MGLVLNDHMEFIKQKLVELQLIGIYIFFLLVCTNSYFNI